MSARTMNIRDAIGRIFAKKVDGVGTVADPIVEHVIADSPNNADSGETRFLVRDAIGNKVYKKSDGIGTVDDPLVEHFMVDNVEDITNVKLDDFATPDDNTDLNATTGHHGLLPKLDGSNSTKVLQGDGSWVTPASGGSSGMSNPMTTPGDLIIGGVAGAPARLAKGSDGKVLGMVAGNEAWVTPTPPVSTDGLSNVLSSPGAIPYLPAGSSDNVATPGYGASVFAVDGTSRGTLGSNIIDGDGNSAWWSGINGAGGWFAIDLGVVKNISSFYLNQDGSTNGASVYYIQTSTNGTDWTTVYTRTNTGIVGAETVILPTVLTSRYFRFLSVTLPSYWVVYTCRLYVLSATPTSLLIGTAGQVLEVVDGLPAWTTPTAGESGNMAANLLLNYVASTDLFSGTAINTTTWTDVITNQNFTVTDANAVVQIGANGAMVVGDYNGNLDIVAELYLDSAGTPIEKKIGIINIRVNNVFGNPLSGSSPINFTGLAVGTHTVKLRIYANHACTAYLRASSVPIQEFLTIQVLQFT